MSQKTVKPWIISSVHEQRRVVRMLLVLAKEGKLSPSIMSANWFKICASTSN